MGAINRDFGTSEISCPTFLFCLIDRETEAWKKQGLGLAMAQVPNHTHKAFLPSSASQQHEQPTRSSEWQRSQDFADGLEECRIHSR